MVQPWSNLYGIYGKYGLIRRNNPHLIDWVDSIAPYRQDGLPTLRLLRSRLAVRLRPGVPNLITSERHSIAVEQFLEMLRFEHRHKLAELPSDLLGGGSEVNNLKSNN